MELERKYLIFIFVLVALFFSILLIDLLIPKSLLAINYHGAVVGFRADLKEAKKVPVYPNEQAIYETLINPSVENITIAVKPAGNESYYYTLQAVEITSKLYIAYLHFNLNPYFNREPILIESYENISGTEQNPVIALVHPWYSDETAVRLEDHVIFIKGKTFEDFDLATIKFLMTAMKIEM